MSGVDCIFCAIVAGDLAASEIYRDEQAVAFLDLNPKAAGHTLVVPRRHVADLTSDGDALTEIAPVVSGLAAQFVQRLGAAGINVQINSGSAAGQEVFHLHVHLVPRGLEPEIAEQLRRDGSFSRWSSG